MKTKISFFSSRNIEKLYNFIIPVALQHAEEILKKKLYIIYPKKYFPNIKFLLFLFKIILNGSFFNDKKFVKLEYNKFLVGRYVLSHSMRYAGYYKNSILFNFSKFKYFLILDKIFQNIEKLPKHTKAAYIDHGMYLNGIYFQGFQKKKMIIYTNNFPKGFCIFDFRKFKGKTIQYSNLMALNNNYNSNKKILKAKKELDIVLKKPTTIPWMKKSKFKDIKNLDNYKKATHLIYAHSFLEAQFMYGYDGFVSYEKWLEFTIDNLNNENNFLLVKAHPSFYVNDGNYINRHDISIFNKIKQKYENSNNIIFIDYPLQNNKLLKILNKKTVVVSRHSTAIIEALYLGLKVISSSANFWNTNKLKLCDTWKNPFEYRKLLVKPCAQLSKPNMKDFYSVTYDLFCKKSFNLGTDYFVNLISNYFDIPVDGLENLINKKLKNKKDIVKLRKLILKKSLTMEKL